MGQSMTHSTIPEADIAQWRKETRARLLEARNAMSLETQEAASKAIATRLQSLLQPVVGLIVGAYWPFRGEPELRDWFASVDAAGGSVALPVIIAKDQPLQFRLWRPGEALIEGRYKIPIPEHGAEAVPDIVVSPVVGFDRALYRLGYGSGFYDRTLAALEKRPRSIGVGYAAAELPTIYPQAHDIRLDAIVTEDETILP